MKINRIKHNDQLSVSPKKFFKRDTPSFIHLIVIKN